MGPDTALARARRGPWSDREWLAWNIEARLRELISGLAGAGEPPYLATPDETEGQLAAAEQKRAQERRDLEERREAARAFEASLTPRTE